MSDKSTIELDGTAGTMVKVRSHVTVESSPFDPTISQNIPPSDVELATTVAISPVSQQGFLEIISEDATETLAEYEALDTDINERTAKWMTRFADVMAEFEEEILPLLDRMNSLLSHHSLMHTPGLPGWGAWYANFSRSIKLNWHMRTVQRKLAKYRGEDYRGEGSMPTGARGTSLTPEQATAAKLLADAKEQFGKSAAEGNEQAAAIIAEYEKAVDDASAEVADVPTPPVRTTEEKNREHLSFFVKRLGSISEALQQVVDDKAKWSAYSEYAEVIAHGQGIASLVNLL
jgi:hypothetical protein